MGETAGRRIALAIESSEPGGAENVVLLLAEGLRARGRDQARTLLQVARGLVGEGEGPPVDDLDQIRRKGHHFLESADRPIPLYELEATLNVAEQWVRGVAGRVYAKDRQTRLL